MLSWDFSRMFSWDSVISCWLAGVYSLCGFSVVSDDTSSCSPSSMSLSVVSFPSSSAEEYCTSFSYSSSSSDSSSESSSSSNSGTGESGDDPGAESD
jgi:hypothetical protein